MVFPFRGGLCHRRQELFFDFCYLRLQALATTNCRLDRHGRVCLQGALKRGERLPVDLLAKSPVFRCALFERVAYRAFDSVQATTPSCRLRTPGARAKSRAASDSHSIHRPRHNGYSRISRQLQTCLVRRRIPGWAAHCKGAAIC